ncbi:MULTISPECIES: hypothetical protein [unclassified Streptomyces]|uniref:hypothetical protein n=1 Tax=unclassified Streptomyces TaxID=2593676 RepID=UPI00190B95FA|nr:MULTISPECIES: hypothetical protein [unclassified Streptomyces]MBK3563123.1 hypothetical protein [Streptomyces sp. MBT62]MBK6014965.1 hypothetical protein [Streptomyces sp. MBT53]
MNLRLLALAGVAVCAVALPLAVASAGPVRDEGHAVVRSLVHSSDDDRDDDRKVPSAAPSPAPTRSPLTLGLGLATAARCGPELSTPDGIEAQTCVMTQGEETWARTYYRNATGDDLDAVLSLMGPADRTVQMHCAVSAEDEPSLCETPREHTQGGPADYTAVAEFAAGPGGHGPLLLRSGSNSSAPTAS